MNNKTLRKFRFGQLAFAIMTVAASVFGQVGSDSDLNGTYRIDAGRSDDVSSLVDSVARSNNMTEQQRTELEDQLTPPDIVSIKTDPYDSNRVTVSTSSSAETTFQADGRSQRVGDSSVSATLRNGVLRLSKVGGNSSFRITFKSAENGAVLHVTRMVTTGYLDRTVYADSYYSRQGAYASVNPSGDDTYDDSDSDDGYSSSDPDDVGNNPGGSTGTNYPQTRSVKGTFIVPKGVVLTGTLNNKITTKSSQDNDRFTMFVESPGEFQGAVVRGYLSGVKRSGRVTGSSRITFNFETIRLRTGETYDFAGVLQRVTDSTGKIIDIGDEGDAKGDSKTKESIKRGGIGAGLGAIIGGILGGAKGAIIGATIGGGAGAGSVIAQGRGDIELLPGSTMEVESSSPNTVRR